ncbi:ER membrane protein complex subunit 8/9-like protein [Iris pallida]|uniref:ER membrane protein complex subunit 8/9-like protein n=1 Tax=Iris pallida TaxID=29817 RepID=A0AAX6F6Y5_IRIPA|nr:ER membrane protein complex subunit 8/9-like protein [Iris pallida]KAJ6820656.1 ER membrane protein complex subunit 8/9-like protein [Iris pallida]
MGIECKYEVSQTAYIKLILHALKHRHTSVNGLLLGRLPDSSSAERHFSSAAVDLIPRRRGDFSSELGDDSFRRVGVRRDYRIHTSATPSHLPSRVSCRSGAPPTPAGFSLRTRGPVRSAQPSIDVESRRRSPSRASCTHSVLVACPAEACLHRRVVAEQPLLTRLFGTRQR